MGSALRRGRTLDPKAVAQARKWREERKKALWGMLHDGTAWVRELRELSCLEGRRITYSDRPGGYPKSEIGLN